MTRKELRAQRARVVGNILPVYSEMIKNTSYEVFNCKQEENGSTKFKDINSTTRNLYSLSKAEYYISNLLNWICEKPRSGTGITGANLKKVFITDDGKVNIGRGYLTIYRTPVIYDIQNVVNPESFIFTVKLSYDSNYAYTLLGFINSAENNVNPGISKKINNLVSYYHKDDETHTLEFKGKQGMVYLFLDGLYTGQYLDISGQTRDLMCAFYMGSASSSYKGIEVSDIHMEPMSSIYPATYLASNTDVWITDKVKNGTSVSEANLVAPHINTETGRMNAGRGYCVYLKKGIINPYNQELYETGFTLSCEVYWDNGSGQEVLFGELNSEGTDIIGAFKKSLADICDPEDVTDKLKLQWKYKHGDGYLFVNNKYTGVHRELSSINLMLGMYNRKDLTPANTDGVELYNIQIDNTVNIFPFTYQFRNLNNWSYQQYTGSSATTLKEPSLVDNDSAVDIGGAHYAYLNAPLMIYDNVDYNVTLTFTGNYQRIGLGRITFVNDKIRPTGIDQLLMDYTTSYASPHLITYKVLNQIAYLFIDNKYTGVHYDFTSETYPIFMGFYDNNTNSGIKILNMEANRGTLTSPPTELYHSLKAANWTFVTVSTWTGTHTANSYPPEGVSLGPYVRNIFKVPFSRSKKYRLVVSYGSNAYIGLTDNYSSPRRWETIQINSTQNFNVNNENTIELEFDGELINYTVNGSTVASKRLQITYGMDLYFIEYQNNDNTHTLIHEIQEITVPLPYKSDDWSFEDIGFGTDNRLCITPTGAVLGFGGRHYYNTKLLNGKTYKISFQYGEECVIGLNDTRDSTTEEIVSEYYPPQEVLQLDGSQQTLLIKLNGGRITYNLNNEGDTYINSGLDENYEGLYFYMYTLSDSAIPAVIKEIREY